MMCISCQHHSQHKIRKIGSLCNSEERNQKRVRDSRIEFNGIIQKKKKKVYLNSSYIRSLFWYFSLLFLLSKEYERQDAKPDCWFKLAKKPQKPFFAH